MEKIITAMDVARRNGFESLAVFYIELARRSQALGRFRVMWDGIRVGGEPLAAYIDFGRWLVRCECGQNNYVDPLERVVFCAKCGNKNNGMARPVSFPPDAVRRRIERALLARPVIEHPRAKDEIERARLATPVHTGLPRCWHPSQTVDVLEIENTAYGVKR
jgi:hypothetical protein